MVQTIYWYKYKIKKEAKNEFEKDFFKLMNNSVFGKTMENIRNYGDIKLVNTDKRSKKLVSQPNYYIHKKRSEFGDKRNEKKKKSKDDEDYISWHVNIRHQQNTYA